jgi:hypothetical protein
MRQRFNYTSLGTLRLVYNNFLMCHALGAVAFIAHR